MCALDRWQNKYPHLEKRKSTIHTKCSLQKVAVSKSRQGPHSEQPLLSHCPQQGLCYGSLFYYFFYLSLLLLILLFASPVVTGGCDMFTGGKSLLEVRVLWKYLYSHVWWLMLLSDRLLARNIYTCPLCMVSPHGLFWACSEHENWVPRAIVSRVPDWNCITF